MSFSKGWLELFHVLGNLVHDIRHPRSSWNLPKEKEAAPALAGLVHAGGGGRGGAGHDVHRVLGHPLPPPRPGQAAGNNIRLVQCQIRVQIIPEEVLLQKFVILLVSKISL